MRYLIIGLVAAGLVAIAIFFGWQNRADDPNYDRIRIGWQTAWATQGQLTQVLKRTDVLAENQLQASFEPASYGGPLNEAALSGKVDVIFTADQPAIVLISKSGGDWVIVSRLMYNRVGLYVPPYSPIIDPRGLKGKTVAVPFGAAAQRFVLKELRDYQLSAERDVNVVNLGVAEQMSLVNTRFESDWGSSGNRISAIGTFDPAAATLETDETARPIAVGNVVSVVVMRREFLEANPDVSRRFLSAFTDAWGIYQQDQAQANQWFVDDSNLAFSDEALDLAASVEPNLGVDTAAERSFDFSDSDLTVLQEAEDFLVEQGIIDDPIDVENHIDTSLLPEKFQR